MLDSMAQEEAWLRPWEVLGVAPWCSVLSLHLAPPLLPPGTPSSHLSTCVVAPPSVPVLSRLSAAFQALAASLPLHQLLRPSPLPGVSWACNSAGGSGGY